MTCCHHWLIETPAGPTSMGECKLCHEVREFVNTPVEDVRKPGQKNASWAINPPDKTFVVYGKVGPQ